MQLKKKIPIYGNGKNIRDWIFVEDHCMALLKILQKGKNKEKYNIGGNCELSNIEIAKMICEILNKKIPINFNYTKLLKFVKDRPGHDFRYAINSSKMKKFNWVPKTNLKEGLIKISSYYINKYN